MADSQRILLVTDAANGGLSQSLEKRGFAVSVEPNCQRAYRRLTEAPADLLIVDLGDAPAAVDLVKRVRGAARLRKVLIMTLAEWGSGQPTLLLSQGVDAFEPKPIDAARLVSAAERLLRPRMAMTAKVSSVKGESAED